MATGYDFDTIPSDRKALTPAPLHAPPTSLPANSLLQTQVENTFILH